MDYFRFIVPGCWLVFLIYLIIVAQKTKRTVESKGLMGGSFYRIIMLLGGILYINPKLPKPFDVLSVHLLPDSLSLMFFYIAIVIGGLTIAIVARKTLADNWSVAVTFKEDHELITTGIYHVVRHPIYTGLLLMFTGTTLFYCSWNTIIAFVIMVIAIGYKIRLEEKMMSEHFPGSYAEYKEKTKAILPFIL